MIKIMNKMNFILIIIFLLVLTSLSAQEISEKSEIDNIGKKKIEISELSDDTSVSLINFFMALSFVIGLIFLSTYFFKKITGIKTSGLRGQNVKMSIISNLPLGDKKFLLIVEVAKCHHFIGVTPASISYLSELSIDPESIKPVDETGEFSSILEKAKKLLTVKKK